MDPTLRCLERVCGHVHMLRRETLIPCLDGDMMGWDVQPHCSGRKRQLSAERYVCPSGGYGVV